MSFRELNPLELREQAVIAREEELARQVEEGYRHPLMDQAAELAKAAEQLERSFPDRAARAAVREQVADFLDTVVAPQWRDDRRRLDRLSYKLRAARKQCWFQMEATSGKTRTLWDTKASEPLLCPDDAREEAKRLQRRLEEKVRELAAAGYRVYYGVLTIENAPLGALQSRIDKLWRKFKRALKVQVPNPPGERIAKKDRAKLFPIVGAIATLEAPLSASRTWHPHLNVIAITRGYFDWQAWHGYWQAWSKWQRINPENVEGAFRELIKYAVRAVPEKSAAKAAGADTTCTGSMPPSAPPTASSSHSSASDSSLSPSSPSPMSSSGSSTNPTDPKAPGPPLIHWRATEFLEWWLCMKGKRRTRTYGELFGLNKRPKVTEGTWRTIGKALWTGVGFELSFPLLSSIPGDKSIRNVRVRYERWLASLWHPPNGWTELGRELTAMLEKYDR